MKKRILSALLTLGMVLTMLPVSVFATEPGDGSGTTSYGANLSDEAVGVPEDETVVLQREQNQLFSKQVLILLTLKRNLLL